MQPNQRNRLLKALKQQRSLAGRYRSSQTGTGDCDPIDARYGRCIEIVDLRPIQPTWVQADRFKELSIQGKAQLLQFYPNYYSEWSRSSELDKMSRRKEDFARLKTYSALYAQQWEELVYRWKEDDELLSVVKDDGFKVSPTPSEHWDFENPYLNRTYSVPEGSIWLDPHRSFDPLFLFCQREIRFWQAQGSRFLFRNVNYAIPPQHGVEPIPAVMLKGRFALRLGFNTRIHDYDMMDGDPATSGPFFEQMYPYQTIYEVDNPELIPLYDFRHPKVSVGAAIKDSFLQVSSLQEASDKASREFGQFYRLVATQVLQFSMQDYTVNHMRILAALTIMRTPPGSLAEATGISRNLNAAAQGQTDDRDLQEAQIQSDSYGIPDGFQINYQTLPDIIVVEWLKTRGHYTSPPNLYFDITNEATAMFGQLLAATSTILEGITDQTSRIGLLRMLEQGLIWKSSSTLFDSCLCR